MRWTRVIRIGKMLCGRRNPDSGSAAEIFVNDATADIWDLSSIMYLFLPYTDRRLYLTIVTTVSICHWAQSSVFNHALRALSSTLLVTDVDVGYFSLGRSRKWRRTNSNLACVSVASDAVNFNIDTIMWCADTMVYDAKAANVLRHSATPPPWRRLKSGLTYSAV